MEFAGGNGGAHYTGRRLHNNKNNRENKNMKPLLVFGLSAMLPVLMAGPAGAKPVYKCEEGGKVTFTDQPCAPGASPAALPEPVITAPLTRAEQDLARAHEARLARERAERDREDAQWLKERAEAQERAERERKAQARPGRRKK
jgi:Domain of unknown function (DUF4124)